ncbi:MAG: hypothetical protein WD025_08995 [Bacteriovoracaceae bacterium]
MIITQKYHSSSEIDAEFVASLEELLQDQVPSFEWIKIKERLSPQNVHFSYYLFFGDSRNSPIGYAQLSIVNEEIEKSLIGNLFKKNQKIKRVYWSAPTATEEGIVFDPAFLKGGLKKAAELFKEYGKRKEVVSQTVTMSDICFDHSDLNHGISHSKSSIASCLVKNKPNYEEYLKGLPSAQRIKVEKLWKELYKNHNYRIGEYEQFKECFEYKKFGSKQYKYLRKDEEIKTIADQSDLFLTFESPDEIFAFVFLFYGKAGNIFFRTLPIAADVKDELLIQAAIMRFFEEDAGAKLRFLDRLKIDEQLKSLGFTYKTTYQLALKDD